MNEREDLSERVRDLETRVSALEAGPRVRDSEGRVRAGIFLSEEGDPVLALLDKNEEPRAVLSVAEDPSLLLLDAQGNTRLELAIVEGNPRLAIGESSDDRRIMVTTRGDDSAYVFMWDKSQELRLGIGVDQHGADLDCYDDRGKRRFTAGCRGGVGGAVVFDEDEVQTAMLMGD